MAHRVPIRAPRRSIYAKPGYRYAHAMSVDEPGQPDGSDGDAPAAAEGAREPAAAGAEALQPWLRVEVTAEPHVLASLRSEPMIARMIDAYGPYRWDLRSPFRTLTRSVVSQSVSTASAAAVLGRLDALTGGTPGALLAAEPAALRSTGLSWSKVDTLRRAAEFERAGELRDIGLLDDAEVAAHLTQLKGIGSWTAHMFLFFCLGRLDVWPVGDLAVRQQVERRFEVTGRSEVAQVGERFRPFRSAVAWYMWRAGGGPQP